MIHCESNALRNIQHLHSPAHIMHNTGIGIDIPFKSHLFSEHFLNKRTIVCESKRLEFQFFPITIPLQCALLC